MMLLRETSPWITWRGQRRPGLDGARGVFQRVLDALPREAGELAADREPIARRGEIGDVVRDGVAAFRQLRERDVGAREQHADVAPEHGRGTQRSSDTPSTYDRSDAGAPW